MNNKIDNNLFKVFNTKTGVEHYFTSLHRVAQYIGVDRTAVLLVYERSCRRNELECTFKNDWKISVVDGSDIKYKDIN